MTGDQDCYLLLVSVKKPFTTSPSFGAHTKFSRRENYMFRRSNQGHVEHPGAVGADCQRRDGDVGG